MEKISESSNLERKFSKDHAQDLRDQTAQEIKRIRDLPTTSKEAPEEILGGYRLSEIYEELQANIFLRIVDRSYFRDLERSFQEKAKERKKELIRRVQEDFERKLDTILENTPLSPEEREAYLSETAVINMSLEDYLVVLKRLTGKFVTHVTRQGVREQTFAYHSKGRGEFHNSFVDILAGSRSIISFISQLEKGDRAAKLRLKEWTKWLRDQGKSDEEVIDNILNLVLEEDTDREPGDRYSSHFGNGDVLSDLYGAEKGYDIFFYYPAEFIAYNYQHKTRGNRPFETGNDAGRNDVFVWNEGNGVPIDASIVCIPEDVMVNPQTGSQYELDGNKIPMLDSNGQLIRSVEQISSKEYWTNFFTQNPELTPNKIMFYSAKNRLPSVRLGRSRDEEILSQNEFWETAQLVGVDEYKERARNSLSEQIKELLKEPRGTEI